jgi:hypothetical protein
MSVRPSPADTVGVSRLDCPQDDPQLWIRDLEGLADGSPPFQRLSLTMTCQAA